MRKKYFVALGALLILLAFLVSATSVEFWASKKSNKYHYPNCRWAQKIKPTNLIKFSSPEEAVKAGYIPCKVCKPPLASKSELKLDGDGIALLPQEDQADRPIVAATDVGPW
jgi:methylphosphotriester-DNA--protein-cysteine methyltransferase